MIFRSSYFWALVILILVLGWMFSDDLINNSTSKDDDNNSKAETSSVDNLDAITNNLIISAEKVKIGRAHVRTPVTSQSRMPSSA